MQSISVPAIFEVCKEIHADNSTEYDNVWMLWAKKHKFTVARGERVIRREAKRDGTDVDLMLKLETTNITSELKALPRAEQLDRCTHVLEVVRSET